MEAETEGFLREKFFTDSEPNKYTVKGSLYLLMAEVARNLENCNAKKKDIDKDLTTRIIAYVEKNFREDITLHTMAEELGYHYQYLSRVIQKNIKIGFRTFVNQYRFDYARFLMEKESVTVTQAALEAGFQSVRNFNRIYKEKTGESPQRGKTKNL